MLSDPSPCTRARWISSIEQYRCLPPLSRHVIVFIAMLRSHCACLGLSLSACCTSAVSCVPLRVRAKSSPSFSTLSLCRGQLLQHHPSFSPWLARFPAPALSSLPPSVSPALDGINHIADQSASVLPSPPFFFSVVSRRKHPSLGTPLSDHRPCSFLRSLRPSCFGRAP